MDADQMREFQADRRVDGWCSANRDIVPPAEGPAESWGPLTRQHVTLAQVLVQIENAAAGQQVHYAASTLEASDEGAVRKHLRDELRSVTQVAQAMRRIVPGISILRMPPAKTQSEALLKASAALAQQAATYESVLIEHGLAHDFVAQLQQATTALKASIDGRGAARSARKSATAEVADCLVIARRYVQLLDAGIAKALRNDVSRLTEWKTAKHVIPVRSSSSSRDVGASSMFASSTPTPPALVSDVSAVSGAAPRVA